MKLLSVDKYIDFKCIGDECPISCCGGNWGIPIDEESYDYYMSVEGDFGDRLRSGIVRMNGSNVFRLDEKTRDCFFLNENKLCNIYKNLGPDALCETCRTYPRAFFHAGDIEFCYLANSCPEVNRMIMQRNDHTKILFDDSDIIPEKLEDDERKRFEAAVTALKAGINMLQNRDISVNDRLYLLLFFIERFQLLMRNGKDVTDFIALFMNPDLYRLFLESKVCKEYDIVLMIHQFFIIYKSLMADSYNHPMWKKCIKLSADITDNGLKDMEYLNKIFMFMDVPEIQTEFEQILVYRFFAVFMQGFKDNDYFDKLAYEINVFEALVTYTALVETVQGYACSQEDRILFYSLCGRIDHSKRQKEHLVNELRREGLFEMDKLIRLVG